MNIVFEITLKGFDASTDETDHLIKWVDSDQDMEKTLELVRQVLPDAIEIVPTDHTPDVGGIDYRIKNGVVMSTKCELINGQFSWILRVDGEEITFNGSSSADYFEKHYSGLGYTVVRKDESNG